jgi:Fe-S cluster assembly protein SufD
MQLEVKTVPKSFEATSLVSLSASMRSIDGASASVTSGRERSRQFLKTFGLPNRKVEAWKYTSLRPFAARPYESGAGKPVTIENIAKLRHEGCLNLVIEDGHFNARLSDDFTSQVGLRFGRTGSHRNDVALDAVTALNGAFLSEHFEIYIEPSQIIEKPVHVIWCSAIGTSDRIWTGRMSVRVGEHASVKIMQTLAHQMRSSSVMYIDADVEKGGRLDLITADSPINVVSEPLIVEKTDSGRVGTMNIRRMQVDLHTDATLHTFSLSSGGALLREELLVNLLGENASSNLSGLMMAAHAEHHDHQTSIVHAHPQAKSDQYYKAVLKGEAQVTFNGKICVAKGAKGTASSQLSRALLLDDLGEFNAKPQLEIENDDVKCSHGSSVGQLDADQMFYLRSRGISEAKSKSMLCSAFVSEIISRIEDQSLRRVIQKDVLQRMNRLVGSDV